MTRIGIIGATGRMGRRLIALATASRDLKLVAAIVSSTSSYCRQDAGIIAGVGEIGVVLSSELTQTPDVMIDFSLPPATRHWLGVCAERSIALVIGTTGLEPEDFAAINVAAKTIPILQASNTSLGVSVLLQLVAEAARLLDDRYDIEITETHHRFKKDAPSGTALSIADAILEQRKVSRDLLKFGRRAGDAPRAIGEIGMHSLRLGDEVGRHTVSFATMGERIELTHAATSRDTFAAGALTAARWLTGQKPGRYSMAEMLADPEVQP